MFESSANGKSCYMIKQIFVLILIFTLQTVSFSSQIIASNTLKVLTYSSEPFVIQNNGIYSGFSIDLLDEISKELNFNYQLVPVKNVGHLLSEMKTNHFDMGMASVSITSDREKYLDFSHPYFNSGLDILIRKEEKSILNFFKSFFKALFSKSVIDAIAVVFVLLITFAHLVWLFEKKGNEKRFPKSYIKGISEALWWAAVTVTTVGYGDKTPQSKLGRLVAVMWMFLGIFLISFFTASITSSLTIQQLKGSINGPQDLPGKRVGAVINSTAEKYLRNIQAVPITYKNLQAVFNGFEAKEIDVIVYDAPLLKFYELHNTVGDASTLGALFEKQDYGILFPQESELRDPVNRTLLKIKENGTYDRLIQKWFEK